MAFGALPMGRHGGRHSRPSIESTVNLNNNGFITSFKIFETIDVGLFGIGMNVVVGVGFSFGLRGVGGRVGVVFGVAVGVFFGANKVVFGVHANDVGKTIGGGCVGGVGTSLRVGVVVVGVGLGVGVMVVGGDVVVGLSTLSAIKICSCFLIIDSMVFTIVFKAEIDLS
ncbi:hypothetical protein QVD17_19976 [Tagetes erecta]|uniref:Uncharacterized protein n=1 Tax=Tagetes erecta TaxID=13708 RepID=A0AAD8KNA6_TARER|nr:hypothetical protein QVD17_19976 [Tagetes erecta]